MPMDVKCPLCGFINEFGVRPNPENLEVDKEGYWLDLAGDRVMIDILISQVKRLEASLCLLILVGGVKTTLCTGH